MKFLYSNFQVHRYCLQYILSPCIRCISSNINFSVSNKIDVVARVLNLFSLFLLLYNACYCIKLHQYVVLDSLWYAVSNHLYLPWKLHITGCRQSNFLLFFKPTHAARAHTHTFLHFESRSFIVIMYILLKMWEWNKNKNSYGEYNIIKLYSSKKTLSVMWTIQLRTDVIWKV